MRKIALFGLAAVAALAIPATAMAGSNTATGLSGGTVTQTDTFTYLGVGNTATPAHLGNQYVGLRNVQSITDNGSALAPSPHTTKLVLPAGATWYAAAGAARFGCDAAVVVVPAYLFPGSTTAVGTKVDPAAKNGRVNGCKKPTAAAIGSTTGSVSLLTSGGPVSLATTGSLYMNSEGALMLSSSITQSGAVPGGVVTVASAVIPGTYDLATNTLSFLVPHIGAPAGCALSATCGAGAPATLTALTFTLNQAAKLIRLPKCTLVSPPHTPKVNAPITSQGSHSYQRAGIASAPLSLTPAAYSDGLDVDASAGTTFLTVTDTTPCT